MEKFPDASRISGVRISSVAKMKGISSKSGKPYEMIIVEYLIPQRDYSKEGFDRQAYGYQFKQVNAILDDALFDSLKNLKFLETCTIYMAPMPDDYTKNQIVGVEQDLVEVVMPVKADTNQDKSEKPASKGLGI